MYKFNKKILAILLTLLMIIPSMTMAKGVVVEPKIEISYNIDNNKLIVETVKERYVSIKVEESEDEIYLGQGQTSLEGIVEFDVKLDKNTEYFAKVNVDGYKKTERIFIKDNTSTKPDPDPFPEPSKPDVPEGSTVSLYIRGYNGVILDEVSIPIRSGDTVLGITLSMLDSKGISYVANGGYISSIDGQKEFDKGKDSGWMYSVNRDYPNVGAGEFYVTDGDNIEWNYTHNLGVDLGVDNSFWTGGKGGKGDEKKTSGKDSNKDSDLELENPLAKKLNLKDHIQYLQGYEDGTIRPNAKISREEAATIIYRVLNPDYRNEVKKESHNFTDLSNTRWSSKYIATLNNAEIITGYPDGEFKPTEAITRAEVATMLTRFLDEKVEPSNVFTDIENHWAKKAIKCGVNEKWIKGYPDNSFRPDEPITRAEFVTIINRMLNRETSVENMIEGRKQFKDLDKNAWYYEAMEEAINGHIYEIVDGVEKWKGLKKFNIED